MSLIIPKNQPIAFDVLLNDCDSCDPREYCLPIVLTETNCFQFKQTPCGVNLICDADFQYESSDLVTNGTFTGSAAGWTLGAGWAYAANAVTLTANTGILSQDMVGLITDLREYIIRFTVSAVTGTPALVAKLGGASTSVITAAGTYSIIIVCDNLDTLLKFSDNTGTATYTIDNVELYDLRPCWDYDSGWDVSQAGYATHVAGTTSLTQATPPLTSGVYYRVTFTLSNVTAGSVQAVCGTQAGDAADSDNVYIQYITANGTDFKFTPTNTFDGTISNVEVKALKNDIVYTVNNNYTDELLATVTTNIDYYNEFVTACFGYADIPITNGLCVKLKIPDICSEYSLQLVEDPGFNLGFTKWYNYANFFVGYKRLYCLGRYNANLYQYKYDADGNAVTQTATKYYYRVKISGAFPATTYMVLATGGYAFKTITTAGTYSGVITIAGAPLDNRIFQFGWHGSGVVGDELVNIYVEEAEIYAITEVNTTHESVCIYTLDEADTGCTRVLEAYNDNNTEDFNFVETGFTLKHRVNVVSVNPYYPTVGNEYLFSDGTRSIITGQREKYWMLRIDFVPEWVHDCISLQRILNHFFIDDVEYFVKIEDYIPDFLGGNDYLRLATAQVEVRLKDDTVFNRNCG